MRESSDEEFAEDFGTPGLSDAELHALLEEARAAGRREVRILVKQFLTLRRAARWLVADLDEAADVRALRASPAAQLTRFLAKKDGNSSAVAEQAT